jgi:hypothetical protein
MFRLARTAGTVIVAAALLTGCGLLPTAPAPQPSVSEEPVEAGQTTAEACDVILPVVLDVGERLNGAYTELQANPPAASPLLKEVSADLREVTETLENEEVIGLMTAATDSLDAMIVQVDAAIAGNPDSAALLAAGQQVQEDFSAIDPVCQEATANR